MLKKIVSGFKRWLSAGCTTVIKNDRARFVKNGKVLYDGPRAQMPGELRAEFDALMREQTEMFNQMQQQFDDTFGGVF